MWTLKNRGNVAKVVLKDMAVSRLMTVLRNEGVCVVQPRWAVIVR